MWLSQVENLKPKHTPNARYSPFSQPDSDLRRSEKKLDWTGLDWTGLDWTGLDWNGMDWTGMDWTVQMEGQST